jgi:hypothetical protein
MAAARVAPVDIRKERFSKILSGWGCHRQARNAHEKTGAGQILLAHICQGGPATLAGAGNNLQKTVVLALTAGYPGGLWKCRFFRILYTTFLLSYHYPIQLHASSTSLVRETTMSGQIFYRERQKVKDGSKTPRFRIAVVAGLDLKVYADHLRMGELKQLADATGAELVELKGGGGKKKHDKD